MILCVAAIAAETPEEAEELAATIDLWRLRIRRGVDLPVPSRDEALAYPYTEYDREEIAYNRQRLALGAPRAVRDRIETLARAHEADEAMILTITPDYASRTRSYELLAEAFALTPALAEVSRWRPGCPAIFFGHGNPMNALDDNEYTQAWSALAARIPRPRAILAISAHWYLPGTHVTAMAQPRTIHDFGGFPRELYDVQYPAPGDPALASRVQELLAPVTPSAATSTGVSTTARGRCWCTRIRTRTCRSCSSRSTRRSRRSFTTSSASGWRRCATRAC